MQPGFCSVQGSTDCDLRARWELTLATYSMVLSEKLASEVGITNCYNLGDLTSMFFYLLSHSLGTKSEIKFPSLLSTMGENIGSDVHIPVVGLGKRNFTH